MMVHRALVGTVLIGATASVATFQPPKVTFDDVTASAGIRFIHHSGAFGKKYLPETMGSGVVFFDADADGDQDLFFVNSTSWPGRGAPASAVLYRNNGNGAFTDVTRASGLGAPIYGMGAAAADFDNDGRVDLYVTALGRNRLYRNTGALKFTDVTASAGVGDPAFSTSAAWVDYDKDGRLDLFVANYVTWSIEKDLYCTLDGKSKSYCTPESYKGASPRLYRNLGDGKFEDATRRTGLLDPSSKALGVAVLDYDGDGWPDLFVANDTQPNRLYHNKRGAFEDVATTAGVAFNEAGVARAGMGVDAADYDGSGRPSLIIGNFSNEMMALYTNHGNGLFIDDAPRSTIGRATRLSLTFACFFFDYDLDGWPDIFTANGHVADDVESIQSAVRYAQPAHLFRNLGKGQFENASTAAGAAIQKRVVARGAAYADYDSDGDLDLAITANNGPARLLRNQGRTGRNRLRVRLEGVASNRDGIGAVVRVTAGGRTRWSMVRSGSSYLSQSELPLTFGLDRAAAAEQLEVIWPSGRREAIGAVPANQSVTIREGSGITARSPLIVP